LNKCLQNNAEFRNLTTTQTITKYYESNKSINTGIW
jgi:hypothetical protein